MPLVEIFHSAKRLPFSIGKAEVRFREIWAVPKGILQVMAIPVTEMAPEGALYVTVRCKAKEDRTPEKVRENLTLMRDWLQQNGAPQGAIRVERYSPELQDLLPFGNDAKL